MCCEKSSAARWHQAAALPFLYQPLWLHYSSRNTLPLPEHIPTTYKKHLISYPPPLPFSHCLTALTAESQCQQGAPAAADTPCTKSACKVGFQGKRHRKIHTRFILQGSAEQQTNCMKWFCKEHGEEMRLLAVF